MKAILFSCFLFVILIPYAQAEIYHETVKLKFLSSFALTENIRNNRVMYSMSKNGKPQARYLLQDGGPQERINAKLNSNMCQWYMIASDNQYFHENEEWEVIIVESKSNYKRINPSTPPEGVWPWKPGGNWLTEKTKFTLVEKNNQFEIQFLCDSKNPHFFKSSLPSLDELYRAIIQAKFFELESNSYQVSHLQPIDGWENFYFVYTPRCQVKSGPKRGGLEDNKEFVVKSGTTSTFEIECDLFIKDKGNFNYVFEIGDIDQSAIVGMVNAFQCRHNNISSYNESYDCKWTIDTKGFKAGRYPIKVYTIHLDKEIKRFSKGNFQFDVVIE